MTMVPTNYLAEAELLQWIIMIDPDIIVITIMFLI